MIRLTEVDGVPAFIAPSPGPMSAGLLFRVGQADETLAGNGITHLLEHLALHRHGLTDYHYNGATGANVTSFHMQGSESDVVAFLNGVCDSLADLPLDRLETERGVLRTEQAHRSRSVNESLPLWRYGARGYGLPSYPEFGVYTVTADTLRWWSRTWFTRGNAALWIAGDNVPAGLRLRLPEGPRRPLPAVTSALPYAPAFFCEGSGHVVFDAVVRRSPAAQVFTAVLERELFRALRQKGGYSYTAASDYAPRGDAFATICAFVDSLPDKQDAVLGGFVDVLAKLKAGNIDEGDLAAVKSKSDEGFGRPEADAARLLGHAVNLLTGQPNVSTEQAREQIRAVTPADLHRVAVEAMASALLQTPSGQAADWAGYRLAPIFSQRRVHGGLFVANDGSKTKLSVDRTGVTIEGENGYVTVLFGECAAVLCWPDGVRRLIGNDGMAIHLDPAVFKISAKALQQIDGWVNPAVRVPMPAPGPD